MMDTVALENLLDDMPTAICTPHVLQVSMSSSSPRMTSRTPSLFREQTSRRSKGVLCPFARCVLSAGMDGM